MPIDLTKIPERLTEAVATGNLVPFIGAGVSRQATSTTAHAFPTWAELLERLQEVALKEGYINKSEKKEISHLLKRGKFLMAAQAIKSGPQPTLPKTICSNGMLRKTLSRARYT